MSTTTQVQDHPDSGARFLEYDEYIEARVRATGLQVKATDLLAALAVWLCGSIVFFGLAAAIDGWVLRGGFPGWARFGLAGAYLIGATAFAWRFVLPLLVRRINPVYAARAIETNAVDLKNALVNFLLLRGSESKPPVAVMEAIEEQAVGRLTKIAPEAAIDRTWLVRSAMLLAALVAAAMLFTVVSAKNPLRTFARIAAPWSTIDPPTRVKILEVTPGDGEVFYGDRLAVTARLEGVKPSDDVAVLLTTRDGRMVDAEVAMRPVAEGADEYRATAPSGQGGMIEDGTYRILAGDALSRPFRIDVVQAPRIAVASVALDFPAYTGLEDRTLAGQGDLKVVEGTRVTLTAEANQPIANARLDFEAGGDVALQTDGRRAVASWTAKLPPDSGVQPFITGYEPRFTNESGLINPRPVRHAYEVLPDLAPEIEFVEPRVRRVDLPLDGTLEVELQARDPDFGLNRVTLRIAAGERAERAEELLESVWEGRFTHRFKLSPSQLAASVGDEIVVAASAVDGRTPNPNIGEAAEIKIRVVEPVRDPNEEQPPPEGAEGDQSRENPRQTPNQTPQEGQQQEGSDGQESSDRGGESQQDSSDGAGQGSESQSESGDGAQGEAGESESSESSQGESGQSESGQSESGQSESGQGQSGQGEAGQGGAGQRNQGNENQKPENGGGDGQSSSGQSERQESGQRSEAQSRDSGVDDAQQRREGERQTNDSDAQGQRNQDSGNQDSGRQEGRQGSSSGDERQPEGQSSEQDQRNPAADDGDAFERLQKFLENQQQEKQGSGEQGDANESSRSQQNERDQGAGESERRPGNTGEQGAANANGSRSEESAGGNERSRDGTRSGEEREAESQQAAGERDGGESADETEAGGQRAVNGDGQSTDQETGATEKPGEGDSEQGSDEQGADERDSDEAGASEQGSETGEATERQGAEGSDERNGRASRSDNSRENSGENSDSEEQGAREKTDSSEANERRSNGDLAGDDEEQPGAGQGNEGDEGPGDSAGDQRQPGSGQSQGEQNSGANPGQGGQRGDQESRSGESSAGGQNREGEERRDQASGERASDSSNQEDSRDGRQEQEGASEESRDSESDSRDGARESGQGAEGDDRQPSANEGAERTEGPNQGERSEGQRTEGNASDNGESTGEQGERGEDDAQSERAPNSERGGDNQPAGGQPGGAMNSEGNPQGQVQADAPEGDEANLDYARQATELVLEKLRDQIDQDAVDQEMLNELGWDEGKLRRFVERWERLYQASEQDNYVDREGSRKLDEALQSLGLQGRGARREADQVTQDEERGLRQGRRSEPPAKYRELIRAFNRGMSRGPASGERR